MAAKELELLDRIRVGDREAEHDLFARWRPVVFDVVARSLLDLGECEELVE